MSDEYLWDPSGEPDEETRRLERVLARRRFDPSQPLRRELADELDAGRAPRRRGFVLAAAAAAAVVALAVWLVVPRAPSYRVHGLAGRDRVRAGEELATGASETARVEIGALGRVELGASTRVRVDDCGERLHALTLERGEIRAHIVAQPRLFQVDTPSGRAVDLGCAYVLAVDERGDARVRVTQGQIEMVFGGREVYVPAGASVTSTRERGPQWPQFDAPSAALHEVLVYARSGERKFVEPKDAEHLATLLRECSDEDTLTLWHVFDADDAPRWVREAIRAALLREFPLPIGVDAARIDAGDRDALRRWRDSIAPTWRTAYLEDD